MGAATDLGTYSAGNRHVRGCASADLYGRPAKAPPKVFVRPADMSE